MFGLALEHCASPSRPSVHRPTACSVPQDADLQGLRQPSSFDSFRWGSATGRQQPEIRRSRPGACWFHEQLCERKARMQCPPFPWYRRLHAGGRGLTSGRRHDALRGLGVVGLECSGPQPQ